MTATQSTLDALYAARVTAGELTPDSCQRVAVKLLQGVLDRLAAPQTKSDSGLARRLLARFRPPPPLHGVYLWGDVGRGKTMLMDMFFEAAPIENKRRSHFHAFMADTHERLHLARRSATNGDVDPVAQVAADIASETRLLCFDEFVVNDVADASILARLFTHLIEAGVIVVATSNVEPSRLYEGGRNRDLFLPFIALLQSRLDIKRLDAPKDFRTEKGRVGDVYFTPLGVAASTALDHLFLTLAGVAEGAPATIEVKRRAIFIPQAAGRVVRFGFNDICAQPLSAGDYLALTQHYDSWMVDNIPVLTADQRNEARRLITLIDVLYEAQVLLAISAAAEPAALYMAPGGAEAHDFARAVSRLTEMRTRGWVENTPAGATLMASTYSP